MIADTGMTLLNGISEDGSHNQLLSWLHVLVFDACITDMEAIPGSLRQHHVTLVRAE